MLALGTKDMNKNSEGEKKSRDSRVTVAGQSRDSRENVAENRGLDKEEDIDIDKEKK